MECAFREYLGFCIILTLEIIYSLIKQSRLSEPAKFDALRSVPAFFDKEQREQTFIRYKLMQEYLI